MTKRIHLAFANYIENSKWHQVEPLASMSTE